MLKQFGGGSVTAKNTKDIFKNGGTVTMQYKGKEHVLDVYGDGSWTLMRPVTLSGSGRSFGANWGFAQKIKGSGAEELQAVLRKG